ncbi:putative leucine-rich repeat-containing protein DDB_G0290503 [Polyergus mexicanus]|uniref:putative leucine-rich repeat-containing protein DDB_G0290503 n=1 Tax=Polyergus mexicanus TaxID=615972 RepID=UPI0038B68DE3
MGDQILITGRYIKVANPQRKRMITPDVILHTRDVMIPVIKSVPFKQSFNIPLSENKHQILLAQDYRNNPALLFSETPSHTLYNPMENLLEVKRLNYWKLRNQSTKYTISEKTNSQNIKKKNISQNSCPSRTLSCKKKSNTLHFPNTMQFQPTKKDENLHKTSSKSIKLSRKCDLSQIRENQLRYKDKSVVMPKMEIPINNISNIKISKPSIISLQSQSFHDFTGTVSTVSLSSVPSFKLENKKTFANIENRRLVSRLESNYLQPNNSEYELNVLHYENDNSLENNLSHFSPSHLKSNINWSSTDNIGSIKMQDIIEIPANKKRNRIMEYATEKRHKCPYDPYDTIRNIKYSWATDSWMPSSQKKEYNKEREIKNMEWYGRKPYNCKIKYSWQAIGTSTQTSYSLLQDLLNDTDTKSNMSTYKICNIKYSWQIIGTSTQASLCTINCNEQDYWNGMSLTPNKNYNGNNVQIDNNETGYTKLQDHSAKYSEKRLKRYLILNNQQTQTFAEKEVQADTNDYYAKYSWHNLIKQYLSLNIFSDMEQILEALTNQSLSDKSEIEQIDNRDELLDRYMIKPLIPNPSKNSVISNNGNEKTKKEELLMRLTYTLKKLNRYERNDKNYDTNVAQLEAEGIFTQKEVLSRNVEKDIKGIIQSVQEYITKLDYQLKDLDNADQQIENSMRKTLKDVDGTFQSLLDDVCYEINKRREELILEAEIHKHESLIPLRACRREVEAQIQNAQNIISMSENIQHPHRYSTNKFEKIIAASNDIGRIPAVPYSEELPNINFDRSLNSYKEEIIEQISKLGCISRTVPVQITNIEERPAGLFVKWHITNPEYTAEEQTFIVEKANGEILDPMSREFETVYKGSETFCFVRNIPVNQPVTLRIRIQADNVAKSVHHIARTSIPPYSWELDNKHYMITNNGKTAAKLTDTTSTLFSHGPQFDANHIIEFKFLEVSPEGDNDEGIALVYNPRDSHDTLKRTASLMITSCGKIFMDGNEKLMRLPKMCFGTNITISAFRKNSQILRVNIESENKCVTYDWRVQTPLFFAARFTEYKKWSLMVK